MTRQSPKRTLSVTAVALLLATGFARAQAPSPPTGTLIVRIAPAASVYVDSRLVPANASEHRMALAAGAHRVRVLHPDYQDVRRTIDVTANGVVTLVLSLPDDGVRKPVTPSGRGRGAAPAAAAFPPRVTDVDLARGIQFVTEGDFAPAVETLFAATRNLAGVPRMIPQQALGFVYLGVAWVEIGRVEQARRAFALARRLDKTLSPGPTDFSKRVLSAWDDSRSIPSSEDIDLSLDAPSVGRAVDAPSVDRAVDPPSVDRPAEASPAVAVAVDAQPAEPPQPTTSVAPSVPASDAAAPPDAAEFITESANAVTFQFVAATPGKPCAGALAIDRAGERVAWSPVVPDCAPAFDVPFVEVRSPAAGPHGGLLLQFRSDRPSIVLMPAPDADLLEDGVDKLTLNELPPETRIHMRRANKQMLEALGRPAADSLFGMLVDVPLGDLLDNPGDYEGGIVRTRGRLVVPKGRGPYLLTEDTSTLQLVPTSTASVMMKSKAAEWNGKELVVRGTFSRPALARAAVKDAPAAFVLTASTIEPADAIKYDGPARALSLEELVKAPPRDRRELVRVVGKFRGQDFFGDLPLDSRRSTGDWVIRDQVFSIWVTGKPPAGNGFALDSSTTRDPLSFWLAVTGTVEERKGYVYLRANKVELATSPSDAVRVRDPSLATGAARSRPDVIFTAPVEALEEASRDQQFFIQFTKNMDEASVRTHVLLRYADGAPATFPRQTVTYYRDRNYSIMIDPGSVLQPGRTLECVLLPGIKDADGLPLVGTDTPAGRVFRWKVRSGRP